MAGRKRRRVRRITRRPVQEREPYIHHLTITGPSGHGSTRRTPAVGYQVRVKAHPETGRPAVARFFNAAKYGGEGGALTAAIRYRSRLVREGILRPEAVGG